MKTNTIIILVAVVAVAVGAYFFLGGSSSNDLSSTTVDGSDLSQTASTTDGSGKKMAFSEFIKQGGVYKCTVNQNVGGTATVGTTYVSGDLLRGDYNTTVSGMNITSSLIVTDGYTYSWSSAYPSQGFKSKIKASGVMEDGSTGTSASYSFNAEQIGDYDCQPWAFDASVFALPAGVTFKEV